MNKKFVWLAISVLWFACCGLSANAFAAIPHLINYQGRVTDTSGNPLNGSYSIAFRIYDALTAGNLLWEEAQSGVVVDKGLFGVSLGSVTALNLAFDKSYFLEIKVGTEVMSPRQQITSSGYAFRSETTDSLPRGIIVAWAGKIADIPTAWLLCNGTNGTPDLRDKFIIGAKQDDSGIAKTNITGSLTQVGGSATKDFSHSHSIPNTGWGDAGAGSASGKLDAGPDGGGGTIHQTGNSVTSGSGGSVAQDILNPYYALAFIMKA